MATTKRIRWECPSGKHPGVLGPQKPRRDAVVRFCLPCSEATGRLIERIAPALERKRQAAAKRAGLKAAKTQTRKAVQQERDEQADTQRYTVSGIDLRDELKRYVKLPVYERTFRSKGLPRFDVTRREWMPNRQGFASPWEWRIHMTLTPNMPLDQARTTLLHELAHLHVGRTDEGWHGVRFRRTLNRALIEAGLKESV